MAWKTTALMAISRLLGPKDPGGDPAYNATFFYAEPHPLEVTAASRRLSDEEVSQRFESRRQVLHLACQRHLDAFRADRHKRKKHVTMKANRVMPYNVSYCPIPKTGSTTWRGIFKMLKGANRKRPARDEWFPELEEQEEVSFTFVREPYSRLLSAYVDKLYSPNMLYSKILGQYIIKHFRPNATSQSLRCGFDVTFPEFIQYFIHMQETGIKRDPHFVPTHEQCMMCENNFTYIGHLETIKEDMSFILKAIHSPVIYNKSFDNTTIIGNTRLVLVKSRSRFKPCMTVEEASRRLWKKWQVRGVISKTQAFPLRGEAAQNITVQSLTQAAFDALEQSGPRSDRVGQKKEALREAFASISLQDRLRVKYFLHLDFQMFGFDPEPEEVFPSSPQESESEFSYLDWHR